MLTDKIAAVIPDRVKGWCNNSVTIAWSYAKFGAGAVAMVAPYAVDLISDPDVKAGVMSWIPAQHNSAALMGIAVVTYVARKRTLGS